MVDLKPSLSISSKCSLSPQLNSSFCPLLSHNVMGSSSSSASKKPKKHRKPKDDSINPDNKKGSSIDNSPDNAICVHGDGRDLPIGPDGSLPANFPLGQFIRGKSSCSSNKQTELYDCSFTFDPTLYNRQAGRYEDATFRVGFLLYSLVGLILLLLIGLTLSYLFCLSKGHLDGGHAHSMSNALIRLRKKSSSKRSSSKKSKKSDSSKGRLKNRLFASSLKRSGHRGGNSLSSKTRRYMAHKQSRSNRKTTKKN